MTVRLYELINKTAVFLRGNPAACVSTPYSIYDLDLQQVNSNECSK